MKLAFKRKKSHRNRSVRLRATMPQTKRHRRKTYNTPLFASGIKKRRNSSRKGTYNASSALGLRLSRLGDSATVNG